MATTTKRYCYVLDMGNLFKPTNEFKFYKKRIFTSKKKIINAVAELINLNKGYDIVREPSIDGKNMFVDYFCNSIDNKLMKIRYVISKLELE